MISGFMESRLGVSSPIREAYELAERLKLEQGAAEVCDLSIGNPTAPCPQGVRDALLDTAGQSDPTVHGYMQDSGYEEVRSAVARSLNDRFGSSLSADDIVMTTGAACALNVLMCTMLDPGDEVVGFLPCYPAYTNFVQNWRGRFVSVPFDERTLLPDLQAFENALTERTKMVIVNSPHNPTGLVYPDGLARGITDVLKAWKRSSGRDVMLVSDEPYRELVYDGAKTPWWPALYDNAAVVYSWSKSASVAGERIGYLALGPGVPDQALVLRGVRRAMGDLGFVNAPATAQRMALRCIHDTVDVSYYDANRRTLLDGLSALGFRVVAGNGAFYLLVAAPDSDERAFVERLAAHRVIVVGGAAFGCPGYVRVSYCLNGELVRASLPAFAEVAREYGLRSDEQFQSFSDTGKENSQCRASR